MGHFVIRHSATAQLSYDHWYYCLYRSLHDWWGESDAPEWSACLLLALSGLLNVSLAQILVLWVRPQDPPFLSREHMLALGGLFVFGNWYRFLRGRRYLEIAAKYDSAGARRRAGWICILGSYLLWLCIGLVVAQERSAV